MASGTWQDTTQSNFEKTRLLASAIFPDEEWILREENIYVAKGRCSVVFFLPERKASDDSSGILFADTIINGKIVEIKAVSGT